MTYACLTYEPDARDSFVTVTMNRPEKLNALNGKLLDELMDAVDRAAADPAINAMILTGAGRAFTTGFDLNGDDFEMGVEGWRKDIQANCDRLMAVYDAPIPIVAAVNGFALAGGLELMLCCDLAIADEDARLGEPEVRHVSGPPSLMLPWLVPMRHVRWLMYTGDLIDGREAARIHLVNKAVPAHRLMPEARRLAAKLARMPLPAIRHAKASLNEQQRLAGLAQSWSSNKEQMAALHASAAGRLWMRRLKEMPLKDFLALREAPFRDLD
ncbi:MAG: enoyl-CoA hydratase/isomerase family protein [Alphaproteobacteria bacterium]|nr:enoyl-CoA hydratase/isomerase family protein [Alphaproteobacteria bacterium]